MLTHDTFPRRHLVAAMVAVASLGAAAASQERFPRPEDAMHALVDAARAHDQAKLVAVLGPGSEDVVSSGDPVDDRAAAARFVAAATVRTRFETLDDGHVVVHLGKEDWPFPVPLERSADGWQFDTVAGRDELLNRRIGRNELAAIESCRAYVEAQRQYASRARDGAAGSYAQKIVSDAGTRDGLYWDEADGRDPSPLGPLFAAASLEGYTLRNARADPQPYHGYFYRVLTAQGPHTPGGARSYVREGRMTDGFALVAYSAERGSSGIMTFVVGSAGIVFQKDLGEGTAEAAKTMAAYDPDESWSPVR